MQEDSYVLYWIYQEDMTDPTTEGYIGITKIVNDRWQNRIDAHLKGKTHNPIITNKKNKKYKILQENLSKKQAEEIEYKLRPEKNIGWNINKGGNIPPSRAGAKWWTNGITSKSSINCPGEGWTPGRIMDTSNIGKHGNQKRNSGTWFKGMKMPTVECEVCGKVLSVQNYSRHLKKHRSN